MSDASQPESDAPTPDVVTLERLPADDWAWLLPHLRAALLDVPDERVDATITRLRAAPAVKLAGGRMRRDAARVVAAGGDVWRTLRQRMLAAEDRPGSITALLAGDPVVEAVPTGPVAPGPDPGQLERVRARARELLRERDEARRRLGGAEVRAETAERRADELVTRLEEVEREATALRAELAAAEDRAQGLVERERRRAATERRDLEDELTRLRRELHETTEELARRPRVAATPRSAATGDRATGSARPTAGGFVAGRPSTFPEGVRRGTREAVDLLLGRGRVVLVDGYNLTRTQRGDLGLREQRRWLVHGLATLVARTGIDPTVIFDSGIAGAGGRQETARGVRVRFTAEGLSADDELVFSVEAMERTTPVVVVTDDRELRDRLRPYAVDLLDTTSFRWVLD